MEYRFTVLVFPIFFGCNSSNNTIEHDQETVRPILKTSQVASLTEKEEKITKTAITNHIQLYSETCTKNKERKINLDNLVFVEILSKNPSGNLLRKINNSFKQRNNIMPAQKGLSIYQDSWLLIGYRDAKSKNKKGSLISIESIKFQNDSTVSVYLEHSKASLSGVSKTYLLEENNDSTWSVTGCKIHARS